jgi:hypothetical protein
MRQSRRHGSHQKNQEAGALYYKTDFDTLKIIYELSVAPPTGIEPVIAP